MRPHIHQLGTRILRCGGVGPRGGATIYLLVNRIRKLSGFYYVISPRSRAGLFKYVCPINEHDVQFSVASAGARFDDAVERVYL